VRSPATFALRLEREFSVEVSPRYIDVVIDQPILKFAQMQRAIVARESF